MGPLFTENEIKMIKRDWKLPNPSYFTYTSIVQTVLQANNPFYKQTTHFYKPTAHFHSFKCSKFKREKNEIKMIKRDCKLPNLSYFTYTSIVQPVLQANSPFSQFLVAFKSSKFEAGKAATK